MKAIFTFFAIVLLLSVANLNVYSQAYTNLGFENWTTSIIGDSPTGWVTLNASKETSDVYDGNYALKLETKNSIMGLQPGLATIGTMQGLNVIPGEPYTEVPEIVNGFIKYNLAEGDTALFYIRLTNNNEIIASADTMFAGIQNEWTFFQLQINWYNWGIPDSIQIGITSGGNSDLIGYEIGTLTSGSWLLADDFSLSGSSSIDKLLGNTDKSVVYPNPSKGFVYVANAKNSNIFVYNLIGKQVMEFRNYNSDRLNISGLPNGNYIFQVHKNNVITTHKVVLAK